MLVIAGRGRSRSLGFLLLGFFATAAFSGCSNRSSGPRQDELEQVAKISNKKEVAKFAGHVLVDGTPPAKGARMFVILSDPDHPVRLGKEPPSHLATCDDDGKFSFTTYLTDDGVPTGKYVVTFVELRKRGAREGRGGLGRPGTSQRYGGADELKNLYNDPQKNKDDPTFVVTVSPPGKTDYDFNLTVAGKDAVKTPGEYAVTHIDF